MCPKPTRAHGGVNSWNVWLGRTSINMMECYFRRGRIQVRGGRLVCWMQFSDVERLGQRQLLIVVQLPKVQWTPRSMPIHPYVAVNACARSDGLGLLYVCEYLKGWQLDPCGRRSKLDSNVSCLWEIKHWLDCRPLDSNASCCWKTKHCLKHSQSPCLSFRRNWFSFVAIDETMLNVNNDPKRRATTLKNSTDQHPLAERPKCATKRVLVES